MAVALYQHNGAALPSSPEAEPHGYHTSNRNKHACLSEMIWRTKLV